MHDVLPSEQDYWARITAVFGREAGLFGYERLDTPLLELAGVFEKGTGRGTDIVEKEMYAFATKGGDKLALRPEWTPSAVRAYIEHGMVSLPRPVKLWTLGPMFRHDRPQRGRYRQFNQFDIEAINSDNPTSDVEIILVVARALKKLGLKGFIFQLSSIGDSQCRPAYERQLKNHLRAHKTKLCPDCRRRLDERPLRVFDCKEEKCQRVARVAPKILDNLCKDCHHHFKEVLEMLDELEIPYQLNSTIVRGLDYYSRTVFEVLLPAKDGLPSLALGGGGRYDGLVQILGGRPTPAVGAALGVERLVAALKEQNVAVPSARPKAQVFVAQLGFTAKKKVLKMVTELQNSGIVAAAALDRDSLKAQMKIADRLGVLFAVIIGQKEVLENSAIIRDMRDGSQEIVPQRKLVDTIKRKLQTLKNKKK